MEAVTLPAVYSRGGLSVELYDVMHEGAEMEQEDLRFLLEQAAAVGGPALELACGTGRVLWPMAQAGFEVTGLDLSPAMLSRAEQKGRSHSAEVRERVRLVPADMRDFELGATFGLVFSTFRSFQALLSVEDQRSCLRCIHRHLRPGGRLVLDLFDPAYDRLLPRDPVTPRGIGTYRHPASGNAVFWEVVDHQNDPVRQCFREVWRWTEVDPDGRAVRTELEELRLRWTFRYELHHLLGLGGFRVREEFSDFRRGEPAYARELVVVCEKS